MVDERRIVPDIDWENVESEIPASSQKKIDTDKTILLDARRRRKKQKDKLKSLGALPGQKLVAPNRQGVVRRWVNGDTMKLDDALNKGYSFVSNNENDSCILTTDLGSAKSQIVGKSPSGAPLRAYLMEIPEEMYREDQEVKEAITRKQSESFEYIERDTRKLATARGKAEIYEPPH